MRGFPVTDDTAALLTSVTDALRDAEDVADDGTLYGWWKAVELADLRLELERGLLLPIEDLLRKQKLEP